MPFPTGEGDGAGRCRTTCQQEAWAGTRAIRQTDAGWLFPLADDQPRSISLHAGTPAGRRPPAPEGERPPSLPRDLLDAVYRDLAALCGLREATREDLIANRSFPEAMETGLYFSVPRTGRQNREVTAALIEKYGEDVIASIPGFTRRDGRLSFRSVRGGREDYAVMGLDESGLAFWGYTRRLPFDPARDDAKYMLLSSSRADEASLAGLPKYHVAGRQYPADRVWFTEGVIKAEIAAARLRCRVVAFYSTSVDQATLREVISLVEAWQTTEMIVAFDADKHELKEDGRPRRPAVLRGEQRLVEAFITLAEVYSAEWEIAAGKGIDDLLTAGGTYRRVSRYLPPTPQPRVPRPCAVPGPVDGDSDLGGVVERTSELIRKRLSFTYGGTAALIGSRLASRSGRLRTLRG